MAPQDLEKFLLNFNVSRESCLRLEAYVQLLQTWQAKINLIGPSTVDDIWRRHIADALQLRPLMKEETPVVADLGSGAGIPGLILALAYGLQVHLYESNGKKAAFLRHVIDRLKLANVEVVQGRSEAMRPPKPFDSVIARALGSLSNFVRVAGHLAGRNGRLLAMKGRPPVEELEMLPAGWKALGVHPIQVPELDAERCLVELARV